MTRSEEPETREAPVATGGLHVQDVLDAIAEEVTASPAVPVAGQVALDPGRMAALTALLRAAVDEAVAWSRDPEPARVEMQRTEAQAALMLEEARRKSEMLLDGMRVRRLREERVQEIIGDSRKQGQVLVAHAYDVGRQRMEEVALRAENARRQVEQACETVRPQGPGPTTRVARAARNIMVGRGGLFSRFFRS